RTTEDIFGAAFEGDMRDRIRSEEFGDLSYDYPGVSYSTFSDEDIRDLEAYNTNAGLVRQPGATSAQPPSFDSSPRTKLE
ncbi:hypothetical protein, partial [Streptococcus pneumoniae]|uniref:hypothetical protein n=1 Tax=Streptococcus pneumoniae TaxID=1313 RepID=UPI0018B0A7BE